ncbi:hypothetical protein GIB67_019918 [Kingdonia uniflora]|uniref:PPC domain-containing protein n=1 Tax=Kingdonia uniflora TaxID=39325 RepID=A0A7J7MKP7_9MAGN|nr:hypothetical protein GIB67_019918 [Kingdonia uniflora]
MAEPKEFQKNKEIVLVETPNPAMASNGDGDVVMVASVAVSPKRVKPKGRPKGSKNKPKPPIIITTTNPSSIYPFLLQVSPGSNIVKALVNFTHRHSTNICILNGSGNVSNVTLKHPTSQNSNITLTGCFEILSLSGSILLSSFSSSDNDFVSLSISIGGQGQVIGGSVVGEVLALSEVFLFVASFVKPEFHRLPCKEDNVKPKKNGWMSVPQFGGWEHKAGGNTDYSMVFSRARANRKQVKVDVNRYNIENKQELIVKDPGNSIVRKKKIISYLNCCIKP